MKSAKSDQRNMIQNKLTNTSHIATNGCQWLGKETERETNSCQFHQAITRMMEDGKQRTTETDQYLSAVDEYVLEEYENIWEKFEMLAQINIKDSTVTRHRKRIKQLIRNDLSMATKLNEIDNQLRTCCRIMTKASACKENEALTHSNCEAERSHIMIFGDSMANISECLKQFETTVNSWLQNVKKRVFSLQKERNQLQVALKSAGIGFPTRTATVFQRATGGAVLRSCFTKHPEMKRKHDRLCEIELQIEKYTSISDKCKQLSQQCKEFTLQSPSYTEAMVKAHIPFTHHYILECDYNGLKYTLEDHDITLIIPEGAVAMDQVIHIEIDATMYGPFVFPENVQPISPIIWLCQKEKDAKLKKSFQLIVPHFLTGLTTEKLQYHQVGFAKAIHSTSKGKDGEMKYKFNRCDSEPHFAMCGNKSYAVLESDHCCFYCLQAKKTPEIARDAGYCLTQIENSLSEKQHEVYFIATYFLDTCFQVK